MLLDFTALITARVIHAGRKVRVIPRQKSGRPIPYPLASKPTIISQVSLHYESTAVEITCYSLLLRPSRGAEYCDQFVCLSVCVSVCLSASISLEPLDRSSRNLVCRSPMALAGSSSAGVALRYVLPVLWTTSRLAVMGATPKGGG